MPSVEIVRLRPPLRPLGPCALTIGNFDGVHLGHQALLDALKRRALSLGLPACVLTFEPHPREYFAARSGAQAPTRIATLRDKVAAIRALGIDRVCIAPFDAGLAAVTADDFADQIVFGALAARMVLIGDDFRFGARRAGDFALLARYASRRGAEVASLPTVCEGEDRVSSSRVRAALAAADFDAVTALIGRPYAISGHVVHGRKLGRQLGFPTMNLRLDRGRPSLGGIFAVDIAGLEADGDLALPAVASLGTRPAIEANGRPILEVYVPGWNGDAYGKLVKVRFRRKLRDEQPFPDLESLRQQMIRDVEAAVPGAVLHAPSLPVPASVAGQGSGALPRPSSNSPC